MSNGRLRRLYYSDNLPVLREMTDESVDLIYLDPPFNSNRAYNIIYPDDMGQVTAFEDTWSWTPQCDEYLKEMAGGNSLEAFNVLAALISAMGKTQINAYLVNMAVRLVEMRRVLKPSGSIYLHCDPTASHYLKIIMDQVFGVENFMNEVIWSYRRWPSKSQNYQTMHDVILFYVAGKGHTFNVEYEPPSESYLKRFKGKTQVLDPETRSRKIVVNEPTKGLALRDVWELSIIAGSSKERLGYPTQKPTALLERIIKASSNEGDIVLDPFCGCGTTVASAEVLKRQWVGVDITYSAIAVIKERFKRQKLNVWGDIEILGEPKTVEEVNAKLLDTRSPLYARKEFEKFCVSTINGLPNDKMGADGGIDGRIILDNNEVAIISVKSGHVDVKHMRELKGLLSDKNKVGILITKEQPSKHMVNFASTAGLYEPSKDGTLFARNSVPVLQILTLDEILQGKQPALP